MSLDMTGLESMTPAERRAEADRILKILDNSGAELAEELSEKELDFIIDIEDGRPISAKMLSWLRHIKDRVLDT
jgi:hypothetical protein